jgi:hypothetical protein
MLGWGELVDSEWSEQLQLQDTLQHVLRVCSSCLLSSCCSALGVPCCDVLRCDGSEPQRK